jgi:NADPH-dependent F420 reductase
MTNATSTIGIIGATGNLGGAIARRLALAGDRVIVGSRDPAKARTVADAISSATGRRLESGSNLQAAETADILVVTVPYSAQRATLAEIASAADGKIVVDTTVPLVPPKVMRVQLPEDGCAAIIAQRSLGPGTRVVSAFHNVAAHKLATSEEVDCDVLVFGDERAARDVVVRLVERCGLRGLHGGALVNSAAAEALTSVLIFMNKAYSVDGAGIRITGQLTPPAPG